MEGKFTIGKSTFDTDALVKRLRKVAVDEVIPYSELSAVIGRDVQNGARKNMDSARRRLINEDQIVFDAVRGIGLKRLDDAGKVVVGTGGLRQIRRMAWRKDKVLASCDFTKLSEHEKHQHNATRTIYQAARAMTVAAGVKRVIAAVEHASDALPLGRTMELFKK